MKNKIMDFLNSLVFNLESDRTATRKIFVHHS